MSNDPILNSVNKEFEKVYREHTQMLESFHQVNDQHKDMLTAFSRVTQDHEAMNRDLAEIKDLLKTILNRLDQR